MLSADFTLFSSLSGSTTHRIIQPLDPLHGEVFINFCKPTSITQELYCFWHPQSSSKHWATTSHNEKNSLRAVRRQKLQVDWCPQNILFLPWMLPTALPMHHLTTSFLVNNPTLVYHNYPIMNLQATAPQPHSMQINPLLKKVQHVALVNNKADHEQDFKLNQLVYKDSIQVDNKILLPCPQVAIACASHLPWLDTFEVTKTNVRLIQVRNKSCESDWICCAHVCHFTLRPKHLSCINLPPSIRMYPLYPLSSEIHGTMQESRSNNICQTPSKYKTAKLEKVVTRVGHSTFQRFQYAIISFAHTRILIYI